MRNNQKVLIHVRQPPRIDLIRLIPQLRVQIILLIPETLSAEIQHQAISLKLDRKNHLIIDEFDIIEGDLVLVVVLLPVQLVDELVVEDLLDLGVVGLLVLLGAVVVVVVSSVAASPSSKVLDWVRGGWWGLLRLFLPPLLSLFGHIVRFLPFFCFFCIFLSGVLD